MTDDEHRGRETPGEDADGPAGPPTAPWPQPDAPGWQPPTAYPAPPQQQPPPAWAQPQRPPAYPPSPGWAPAPGAPPWGWRPARQTHSGATTSLVLGLAAVVGGPVFFLLPTVLGPFAWWTGVRAKREIDEEPDAWQGREQAVAGIVLGVIGTLMLAGTVAAVAALVSQFAEAWP